MTLPEALAFAREHQPSLLAARARISAAESTTEVPGALWYPRVAGTLQAYAATANNSTAAYLGAPGVDLPRIGSTKVDTANLVPYASTIAAVGVRQEIFDFGRIAALEAVTQSALQAERAQGDQTRLDVDFAVEQAYFAVKAAKGVLAAAESAWQRAKANYDMADAGVKAGMRKPIELTRAQADLAGFEVGRVRAQAGVQIAQGTFAAVVGVPELSLDAAGDPPEAKTAPTLNEAISDALAHDPLLRQRQALLAQQQASTRSIAAELRPDLQATASVSGRQGGAPPTSGAQSSGLVPDVPNWDLGLVFTWPLFDRSVTAREDVSRQLEHVRQAEIDEVRQRLGASVQQAWQELQSAQQALPALEQQVAAAKANYDQADARFKAGLGTSVELSDAQALLAQAEVQMAIGRFDYARARAHLGRVIAEGT